MGCEPLSIATGVLSIAFVVSEYFGINSKLKNGCASLTEATYLGCKHGYNKVFGGPKENPPEVIEMNDLGRSVTMKMKDLNDERN